MKFRVLYKDGEDTASYLQNAVLYGYHTGVKANGYRKVKGTNTRTGKITAYYELLCTANPIVYFVHKLRFNRYAEHLRDW